MDLKTQINKNIIIFFLSMEVFTFIILLFLKNNSVLDDKITLLKWIKNIL